MPKTGLFAAQCPLVCSDGILEKAFVIFYPIPFCSGMPKHPGLPPASSGKHPNCPQAFYRFHLYIYGLPNYQDKDAMGAARKKN